MVAEKNRKRRPGRPRSSANTLSKEQILEAAFALTQHRPLQEVSVVAVATALRVTPGTIHYYLDGRDDLTSGVMNRFYRTLLASLPEAPGADWREELRALCRAVYRIFVRYPGISAYFISHNRFRMFQKVTEQQEDYGVLFFERFVGAVRRGGFNARNTSFFAHILIEFITGHAYSTVSHKWPGDHRRYLSHMFEAVDPKRFPHTAFVKDSFIDMDAQEAFNLGLDLLIKGL